MRKFQIIILLASFTFFMVHCSDEKQPATTQPTATTSAPTTPTPTNLSSGEELAKAFCTSCHLYPAPDLLDKKTWANAVLIRMGAFLGIYQNGNQYVDKVPAQWIEPGVGGQRVMAANIYPNQPVITVEEWKKIAKFYIDNAPATLPNSNPKRNIKIGIPFFKSSTFSQKKDIAPVVQAMAFDADGKKVYASEFQGGIYEFDARGMTLDYFPANAHIVDIKADKNQFSTLDMASRYGSDNPKGVLNISKSFKAYKQREYDSSVEKLMRPVSFTSGNLNEDGVEDLVVSEYGNLLGALTLMQGKGNGSFQKQNLFPDDGAIKSEIVDLNGDGKNDIIALQANSDEGIDWYINQGDNQFKRERKLRFLPTAGSTHFQLVDFDGDGKKDLLYSNGDNGDYLPILKPYHGVHLYLNKNGNYKEAFFIPLNGVYQAEAVDFDEDGDLDIATVSFHPDFQNNLQESFVIFINDGKNNFSSHTISQFADGRWMRFLTADVDGDKDVDILLSAMNIKTPEVPKTVADQWAKADNAIIFLENTTR